MHLTDAELQAGTERFVKALRDEILATIELQEADLIAQAAALLEDFREQKIELIKTMQAAAAARTTPGRSTKRARYLALNFFVRHHGGHLQIYWQNVHRLGKTGNPKYQYVRKGTGDGYVMSDLMRNAGPAAAIIRATEERAIILRRQWRLSGDVKRAARNGLLTLHAQEIAKAKNVAPDETNGSQPGF